MTRRRIGIIGGGVAGLTAAYVLSRDADVTVLESEPRLGGHAHTHRVADPDGTDLWVDSGFIVHNRKTYPLLTRLFTELGVAVQESEMSLSVSCAGCGLAYAGQRGLGGLAAGLRGGGLRYARMLTEVIRFHRAARRLLEAGPPRADAARAGPTPAEPTLAESTPAEPTRAEPTLGEFLAAGGYSAYFIRHFALPFVAAVWSCPPRTALRYPARYLFAFMNQHGLLSVTGSPPWLTVSGGSRSYVEKIAKQLASVQTGARVTAVRRLPAGPAAGADSAAAGDSAEAGGPSRSGGSVLVTYEDADGTRTESFDGIVIATHPDQALRLLADPTPAERDVLGAFRYSLNETILHTDSRLLPAGRRVRASWNYALSSCTAADSMVRVSYDMSRLQQLPGSRTYVVTLNAPDTVDPKHVIAAMSYAHPVYDPASVAAQGRLPELNDGVTAYAGAYHGWGFHEDGCRAGVAAARSLGGRW
jgi:predicted NAD/FAD-binding protein